MNYKRGEKEDYPTDQFSVDTEIITIDFQKSEALVGQRLDGRFLIVEDLTESGAENGGFGLVYLAKDLKLMGREVVVKILKQSALESEDIARKFQHEKEALIRIDHPNIVRILDSGTLLDGNPFMVMEYIEGYSLRRALLQNQVLPFDFAAHIIESVTDALSVAHSKKVLHRDIKPANIMLSPREDGFDRVRLIDFGIARVEDSELAAATETQRSIGTLFYIAPEQLWGTIEQTPAVDVYAFAIVIYEMLTGRLPFKPQSVVEMFQLQKEGVKTLPSELRNDLPEEAERILLEALEFEAEKRPQNIRAFGRDLANALRKNINYKTSREAQAPILAHTLPLVSSSEEVITVAQTESSIGTNKTTSPIINNPKSGKERSGKKLMWALLGLLILAVLLIPVGLGIWKKTDKGLTVDQADSNSAEINADKVSTANAAKLNTIDKANSNTQSTKQLTYFLNVQKMRDGKPFEQPFKSSGQEIFENGYKFKMVFQSDSEGFMYLFNEDKDAQGKLIYNILYPTPKTKNGSAQIASNEQIETSNNTFSGSRGTEIVWLIWTAQKQNDLETIKQAAFNTQGTVKDEKAVGKLTEFLQKHKDETLETSKDTPNQQTVVKGNGHTVVHQVELEHR